MAIRFLTGLDSKFNEKMGGIAGRAGQGMMTGIGGSIAGLGKAMGNERLAGADFRPEGVKLKEQLAEQLKTDTPASRQKALQIMNKMGATPEMLMKTAQQFQQKDQDKLDRDAATARDKRDAALAQSKEDRQVGEGIYRRNRDASQDEINATQRVIDNDKRLGEAARSERSLRVREESLALRESQNKDKLTKEEKEQAENAALRKLYIRQAQDNNNKELAEALQKEAFPLEKAASLLYGSSRAQMTAPSDNEAAAMEAIIMSPSFSENIAGFETKRFSDDLRADIKRAIFYKAKELRLRDTKLSIEDALREAVMSVKTLQKVPVDPTLPPTGTSPDPQANLEV